MTQDNSEILHISDMSVGMHLKRDADLYNGKKRIDPISACDYMLKKRFLKEWTHATNSGWFTRK